MGLRELEIKVGNLAFVKSVVGDPCAVGRPPHGGALEQLFAVDPPGDGVLDAGFLAAVGGESDLVAALGVAEPEVAILEEGFEPAIGAGGGIELPAARRPAATATSPTTWAHRSRCVGLADLFGALRGEVVV